ncbi:protein phosphatase 2C domain-containing protein [Bacillaceae bacterium Marseille-Q3522]|nr:protein phosphatase 2C domain-containing protein [Bacillaceae bacterium Marseille-Q3522]
MLAILYKQCSYVLTFIPEKFIPMHPEILIHEEFLEINSLKNGIIITRIRIRKLLSYQFFSMPWYKNMGINLFQEEQFLSDCRNVKGETACLIVLRKDKYVWWFSIGDCLSYLFHPELAKLGQYQINQRQFYEWVGQVNTFEQVIPCYSSGIRELRKGLNRIFLTTDGLIECPNEPFSSPNEIYNVMRSHQMDNSILTILQSIKENNVRDSTTIISWDVNITKEVTIPSDA